ncbi:hypothetical protein [Acutalibacter intestini]|uniref:hypothetical protein n=1 Tax=Acutalibacter intestini TaxID=3093659 RepID=UPI002AC941E2|nr:hypothetical protein [Acutalibacter sp. M00204]
MLYSLFPSASFHIFGLRGLTFYLQAFFLCFALSPIGEKQGAKRKCFLKNPKIFFRGFFKRRKPQKGGLGVATPTRFPQDKMSR